MNDQPIQLRVAGGTPANEGEYPFMAAILNSFVSEPSRAQYCGASVVADDWVMTAAHCVDGRTTQDIDVFVGTADLTSSQGQRIPVRGIAIHPEYGWQEYPDVALVQLQQSITQAQVALLSPGSALENAGTVTTVIGWGMTSENGPFSDVLQEAEVNIVAEATCVQSLGGQIDSTYEFCAGLPQGGKDACGGDSGGPLLVRNSGAWNQVGIVVRGIGCARPGLPGIYTRVSAVKEWVQGIIATTPGADSVRPQVQCDGNQCIFTAPATDAGGFRLVSLNWVVDGTDAGSGSMLRWNFRVPGTHLVTLHSVNTQGSSAAVSTHVNILDDSVLGLQSLAADAAWVAVTAPSPTVDPVVILGTPSYSGPNPGGWRMRQLNAQGFQVRFQEWDYLLRDLGDAFHAREMAGYLIVPAGRYVMSDGSNWQFGRFGLAGTGVWKRVNFNQAFEPGQTPSLFATVQTENGPQAVAVRIRNLDAGGFEAALYEEEALMDGHALEQVAYLAIYSPSGNGRLRLGGRNVAYSLHRLVTDHQWAAVSGHQFKLEEEQSRDLETWHVRENVDLLLLDGKVFAQTVSFFGADTVRLRTW